MATTWNEEQGRWFVDGSQVHPRAVVEMQGRVVIGTDDDGEPLTEPGEWFEVGGESREGVGHSMRSPRFMA